MKIIVLGGTGFLGYFTIKSALQRGHQVTSLSIDDIDSSKLFPKDVEIRFGNIFKMSEDELVEEMKGFDGMIYSIGPDDRTTPPAPSYEFFHLRLVDYCAKCFRAAERAGVKKAVCYNSYFAYFARKLPDLKLTEHHPYIKARVEQAETLLKQAKNMEVIILELPYIFGHEEGRVPIWKTTFLDRYAYGKKTILFSKGGSTMIAAEHVGEAGIGALEYGKGGERYPIGDENKTFRWMLDQMTTELLGKPRRVIMPPTWLTVLGASHMKKEDKKKGLESGLDYKYLLKDLMSRNLFIPEQELDKVNNELHITRGGLVDSIKVAMNAAYPKGTFK